MLSGRTNLAICAYVPDKIYPLQLILHPCNTCGNGFSSGLTLILGEQSMTDLASLYQPTLLDLKLTLLLGLSGS
jgi:hypothetical protein